MVGVEVVVDFDLVLDVWEGGEKDNGCERAVEGVDGGHVEGEGVDGG